MKINWRECCQKIVASRWFNGIMWGMIALSALFVIPEAFGVTENSSVTAEIVPPVVFTVVHVVVCTWFVIEMGVRLLAAGASFFHSRRNVFDLVICALAFVPYCEVFATLRLVRGLLTDPTDAPKKEEKAGTQR